MVAKNTNFRNNKPQRTHKLNKKGQKKKTSREERNNTYECLTLNDSGREWKC